jgi:LPS export ABC transporter protein LptC
MAKIPLKYLPITGIFLLLCSIGYFLITKTGYEGGNDEALNKIAQKSGPTMKVFHYVDPDFKGGKLTLDGEELTDSQDNQLISLNNFRLSLESLDGPSMELKGNNADYDKRLKEIKIRGNVQGYYNNEYRIFTENIIFQQIDNEDVLKTDEPVRIIGPIYSTSGKGLILYRKKETLKIISDIESIIKRKGL